MRAVKVVLGLLFLFCLGESFAQQPSQTKKIEKRIAKGVENSFNSNVRISPYDTVRKRAANGVFSGIVVTAEGHVLTAAHATKPGSVYQVTFPDGKNYLAVGLGRMGFRKDKTTYDVAMMKITDKGTWAYAQMGWIGAAKVNQPALSISYPGSFRGLKPNLRVGRLLDLNYESGYIITSCKMEPGDSGGSLFDIEGRLLGIHSKIDRNEDRNYEVPIDFYRKYWTALNVAKDYKELPEEDQLPPVEALAMDTIPAISQLIAFPKKQGRAVYAIQSMQGDQTINILGTAIEFGSETYVVSKSTMVGEQPVLAVSEKKVDLIVLARDKENDLVLLKPAQKINHGIKLRATDVSVKLNQQALGRFLVSPFANDKKKVGVLSTEYLEMPLRSSVGNFGANATFINEKVTITNISRGSGAEPYLKLQDQIIKINDVPMLKPADYGAELAKCIAGDSVSLEVVRDGQPLQLKVYLPAQPPVRHVASQFDGGRSTRSDGFKQVLVQDAAIKKDECGGPVFDADGNFYGINIARHSRTSTIIMPADVIKTFINTNIK